MGIHCGPHVGLLALHSDVDMHTLASMINIGASVFVFPCVELFTDLLFGIMYLLQWENTLQGKDCMRMTPSCSNLHVLSSVYMSPTVSPSLPSIEGHSMLNGLTSWGDP